MLIGMSTNNFLSMSDIIFIHKTCYHGGSVLFMQHHSFHLLLRLHSILPSCYYPTLHSASVNGRTTLMWEILNNHTDIAKLLIQHGANINAQDKTGETPLMIATRKHNSELIKVGLVNKQSALYMDVL